MSAEGVKSFKFANRQPVIARTHAVYLVTSAGDIRAEYIPGTEDYIAGPPSYWSYQFRIIEEDLPTGFAFDDIVEAIFVSPFTKRFSSPETDECCRCFKAEDVEIDGDPVFILGATEQAVACPEGTTDFCTSRLTPTQLAALIQPLLDAQALAQVIEPYLTIYCYSGDPLIDTCP